MSSENDRGTGPRRKELVRAAAWPLAISLALTLLAALTQLAMGRHLWCKGGEMFLWSGDVWSMHNSQHLFDAYVFSHVLHGLLFYAGIWLAFRLLGRIFRRDIGYVIAIAIEVGWEVLENTSLVIERYREQTMSLDYYGDSILNSVADIAACAAGYGLAIIVPAWISIVIFVAVEIAMLLWIRDSLIVNVIMLLKPLEAIKDWQMGGR